MSKKKQVKPEWFNGAVYKKGTTVQNRFGGDSYKLNALELSIYDFIMGASMFLEMTHEDPKIDIVQVNKDLHKGLDWFKQHNIKAYMVLLD